MKEEQNLQEPQEQALNIPVVMRNFTLEDLRKAFDAGYRQATAESINEHTSSIGHYEKDADIDFDAWFENYA